MRQVAHSNDTGTRGRFEVMTQERDRQERRTRTARRTVVALGATGALGAAGAREALDPRVAVERRALPGGPAKSRVLEAIEDARSHWAELGASRRQADAADERDEAQRGP